MGQFVGELGRHGLGFPVGETSSVGLGGYLLAGGLGWNGDVWGPACASVERIEVVTADGETVRADTEHESDLLWLARGSGPLFPGIITEFTVRLQAAPPAVLARHWVFDLDDAAEFAPWITQRAKDRDPGTSLNLHLIAWPSEASPGAKWAIDFTAVTIAESMSVAKARMAPIEDHPAGCRPLEVSPARELTFDELCSCDLILPEWDQDGFRYGGDTAGTDAALGDVLLTLANWQRRSPSRHSVLGCSATDRRHGSNDDDLGGAFSMSGSVGVTAYGKWDSPHQDAVNAEWASDAIADAIASDPREYYIAQTDLSAHPERLPDCFSSDAWRQICAIRPRYAPERFWTGIGS